MLSAPTGTCARHRKRERVATCGACGNDLCVDCVVHTAVGIKCRTCTGAPATAPTAAKAARQATPGRPPRAPRIKGARPAAQAGSDVPGRKRWAIPVAALGLVAVVAAGLGLLRSGDGPSKAGSGDETADSTAVAERVGDFVGAGDLELGATLMVPAGVGAKKAPGVLIVPGGATVDRNGLVNPAQQSDPLFEDLAKSLAEAGVVSLRYDLRGTGASKLPEGKGKSFEDLVLDAKSGLDFLSERRETQGQPFGLISYDNGGFVAMSLAAADPRVKGLVLISTPGRPLVDVLADDYLKEVPDQAQGQALADAVRSAVAQVVSTGQVPPTETLPPPLQRVFPAAEAAYLRGLFSFNPVGEARRVQVPTLVVRGANDTSITDVDLVQLKSNLSRGEQLVATNANNTLALPPGQEGALHNPSRHGTVKQPEAMAAINEWLRRRLVT